MGVIDKINKYFGLVSEMNSGHDDYYQGLELKKLKEKLKKFQMVKNDVMIKEIEKKIQKLQNEMK